ncbi:MAG: type I-G CRISPR-associated helicase/endonuclease Cas3g, partial [Pseudonocardia sp.]
MSLERKDFAAFFRELHNDYSPFNWQERLLDAVLEGGRWPDRVVAPTGAGKTAVIDVHVFAQALAVAGQAPRPPRRLAMVVDRRVLVDDQFEHAQEMARRLAVRRADDHPGVLGEVGKLLWTLHSPDPEHRERAERSGEQSPLVVARLRGGAPPSRRWRDNPTAAAVICATPDMWGSRLLFRGYGSSTLAWPREAGLLAIDSVVVVDEAHLSRQLLCTARRVGQLAQVTEHDLPWRTLQVVETTATPSATLDPETVSVGVDVSDLDDELLAARLTRPKPVTLLPVKDWDSAKPGAAAVTVLADATVGLLADGISDGPARTVGCFVNTVGRAVAVAEQLRRRTIGGRAVRVVMICGQVRPVDLDRLRARYPELLSPAGNAEVDVIVSTQSLEVGVDLDLAAMVTELASGSALAQRAGRVNRRGLRRNGPIMITVPAGFDQAAFPDRLRSGPYAADELHAALGWLVQRVDDPAGLAPWALGVHRPPEAIARRELYQRPELAEAWHWARTSDDLAAEPELDLWLAEDFATDTSVGLVVRDDLPVDTADALRLIGTLLPRRHEVFPVPFRTAREALRALRASATIVRIRGEDVDLLDWGTAADGTGEVPRIRPGDIVVLDSTVELFTFPDPAGGFSPPVVTSVEGGDRGRADDVLEALAALPSWERHQVGGIVHRIELDPDDSELADALSDDDASAEADRATVRAWLTGRPHESAMRSAAAELLSTAPCRTEIAVHRDPDGRPTRVLVIDRRRAAADEGIRQVWTPTDQEVTLTAHQKAVADRAALLGARLELDPEIVDALALAGAHHDDGKQDRRFQQRLGAHGEPPLLAKSRPGTTAERARLNERRSGLPYRWRHEQRSVVDSWHAVHVAGAATDPRLVARLIGTSHGHGRAGFPHTAGELMPPESPTRVHDVAVELFDLGGWDDLIEATQRC